LAEAGVGVLEIPCTVPNVADVVAALSAKLPVAVVIGVGTVLTHAQAWEVLDAGARLVVSPVLALDLIFVCHAREAACIPAGLTPTELLTALNAGADLVKLFPAGAVGGPRYIADILAPLPDLPLMASGSVEPEHVRAYLAAGCRCVGLGSALMPKQLIANGDTLGLIAHARRCLRMVER
jgi:2-dehydro-3-deoxyphosphogluconate aldolase/(4S)-4-hydroxy-2-oxoglutarate aldolase